MAYYGGSSSGRAVNTTCTGGGQTLYKFDLSHWTQFFGPISTVHGPGLYEYSRTHVVAAVYICIQLVDQIPLVWSTGRTEIPKMMMWITDRKVGFQGGFYG